MDNDPHIMDKSTYMSSTLGTLRRQPRVWMYEGVREILHRGPHESRGARRQ